MLCTIAGLDPTSGGGLAADLRTFAAHGGWGTAVLTAVTAQDEGGVRAVRPEDPQAIRTQLQAALAMAPGALKTGMLATRAVLEAIAGILDETWGDAAQRPPLVVDPVLAAGRGGIPLLEAAAIPRLAPRLGPHAALLTPNLPEAACLLGHREIAPGEEAAAAVALRAQGWAAVLLKGGHGRGGTCRDVFCEARGERVFERPRLLGSDGRPADLRGTGCALSAAIAARLGLGEPLVAAVEAAGDDLHAAIAEAARSGSTRWVFRTGTLPPDRRGR